MSLPTLLHTQSFEVTSRFWKNLCAFVFAYMKLPTLGQLLFMQGNCEMYTKRYWLDDVWGIEMKNIWITQSDLTPCSLANNYHHVIWRLVYERLSGRLMENKKNMSLVWNLHTMLKYATRNNQSMKRKQHKKPGGKICKRVTRWRHIPVKVKVKVPPKRPEGPEGVEV
jgi:hypothetical protein